VNINDSCNVNHVKPHIIEYLQPSKYVNYQMMLKHPRAFLGYYGELGELKLPIESSILDNSRCPRIVNYWMDN
jgi:hypothetical protein